MCRRGGPRCTGHTRERLARATDRLRQVEKLYERGEANESQLNRARLRLKSAQEAYSVTTGYEKELRAEARRLRAAATKAERNGDTRKAKRLREAAKDYTAKANYVYADRLAHREAAREDNVTFVDPRTGQQVTVSRFLLYKAVNAQNALANGDTEATPGLNGNLEDPEKVWANSRGTQEEMYAKAQHHHGEYEDACEEVRRLRAEMDKFSPGSDEHKKLRAERRKAIAKKAANKREYTKLMAATVGADAVRSGKIKIETNTAAVRAASFDTINSRGEKGMGVTIHPQTSKVSDSRGHTPGDMPNATVVPGSVRVENFVTHDNGQVVDAQVKINAVHDPDTGQYYTVTRVSGKNALVTSNNSMEGYRPGELSTNQHTSRGRFERTFVSDPVTSKKAVSKQRNEIMRQLSTEPSDSDEQINKGAVAVALRVSEETTQRKLRRGYTVHPYLPSEKLQVEVDEKY